MSITSILADLRHRNIIIRVKGNDLSVVAEKGILSPETRAILANHKQDIVSYLRRLEQKEVSEIQAVDRGPHAPLSSGQRRLWFLAQLDPASSAFVVPAAFHIDGRLEPSLLSQALDEIAGRHEVLRTVFKIEEGGPRQVILSKMAVPVSLIDLRRNSAADQQAKLEECIRSEMGRPFDLSEGPLLRAVILQLREQECVLFLALHHLVADVWSIPILLRELATLYAASLHGRPASLPLLPVQYADYAVWQQRWNESAARTRQVAYWEKQLAGLVPLTLPADHPRQEGHTPKGGSLAFAIPGHLVERLRSMALQHECTLFMALMGAFQVLLSRYSGQRQIALGTQVANREKKEIESLIGCFANPLVLCLEVEGMLPFRQLLGQVRKTVLDAFENQDLPFEELVDALNLERNLNRNPLFQVMFTLENAPQAELQQEEIRLRPIHVENPAAQFDLTLSLLEQGAEAQARLSYNAELFEPATVARMAGHYCVLLREIVEKPERPAAELSLFTEAELSQLLKWNKTAAEYPLKFVHELFEEHAAKSPAALAVEFEQQQLTYEQLNHRANQLGRHLKKLGAGPDVQVGICMERSVEMVTGLLAILKAGAAYVPLDPEYPADRLSFMAEEAKVPVILTQVKFAAGLSNCAAKLVKADQDWESISREAASNLDIAIQPEDLAYVIYTSGSTGRPKGVMNTHRGLRNRIQWMEEKYRLSPEDRVLQKTPYSFDVSVWEFFWPLMAGAGLVVAQPGGHRDPQYLGTLISQEKVSTLHFVPSMLAAFLEAGAAKQCGSLRRVICSGEALAPELARRCMEEMTADLHNLYGPTEASIDVTSYHCVAGEINDGVPIGKPIANTEIHILDNAGHPVPVFVAGELYIGGAGLARGYVSRPDLTAERFVPDPISGRPGERLYRTGDKACWRPDGNVEYLGRLDNQVKIRGYRIELGEIEKVLTQHEAVKQAVVVVREDQPGEKRLVAYLVREQGSGELDMGRMRSYLQTRLPEYMVPGALVALASMPLTANGKLDRKALPRPEWKADEKKYAAPRNAVEEELSRIWGEVLEVKSVGIRDNFFELGGDSIISIQVLARCREAGLKLDLRQLIQQPTIERLAPLVVRMEEEKDQGGGEPFSLISAEDRSKLPPDVEDAFPLSRLQAGMLFHSEFDTEMPLYHIVRRFHLRAPLDAGAFRRAVTEVVERHEILRTSFHISGYSQPLQCVHRSAEIEVEVEDLRHLGAEEQTEVLKEWMEKEKRRRFDLGRAGLLRFHAHRRTEDSFEFWMIHHHVNLDGWSRASLLTELFGCYFGLLKGGWEKRKKLSRHFREFVEVEMEVMRSEEAREFWRERLQGMEIATLPWEKQRTAEGAMSKLAVPIDAEMSKALNAWARELGVSLKTVLLAAHLRVLNLISGQTDVITGITSDGRIERLEGEQVMGLFLNTPPFRMKLRGGSWKGLVRETAEQEAALLPYRRYPLVEIQGLAGRTSLFDVNFNFVHFHVYREIERVGGVEVLGGMPFDFANFALSADFNLDPVLSTLQFVLEHNSLLIQKEQIQSIAGYYQNVLNHMVRHPGARYELTSLLSDSERRQLLVEWNRTAVEYPEASVVELFERQAEQTPKAVAVEYASRQLTYAELNARANQLARCLEKLGAGPETAVGVCMERSFEMFAALLGIMKAGAVYVPLDPGYPADRLRFMAEDSALKLTLIHDLTVEVVPQSAGRIVNLDSDREPLGQEQDGNVALKGHAANLAYIIYTSGSTGKPKGVGISYGALYNQLCWAVRAFQISAADRFLQKASVSFDSSIEEILAPLLAGARVVAAKPRGEHDVEYLTELVSRQGVTCIDLSPSLLRAFLEHPDAKAWSSVRLVISGGEALSPELVKLFPAKFSGTLLNTYGPTETTVQSAWKDDVQPGGIVPIGRPVANTQLFVLNEHLEPVPVGAGGELCIGGAGLARGYINRPGLTAQKFIPDPFTASGGERLYRTGDLVKWRNDGQLEFIGRLDHQVKLRGYRIELGEIESVIESQPQVKQAVVVVREDQPGVQRLVGYVVKADESRMLDAATLREYLNERLPGYMVPAAWVEMTEFPVTRSGKIDRGALTGQGAQLVQAEHVRPRNATEEILAGLWESVLSQNEVSVEASFFDLGGHSLLAMQLISRIRTAFSVEIPLRILFERTTIAALAGWIERERLSAKQEPVPAIRRDEGARPAPLSFAQQRLWFLDRFVPNSPTYNISEALHLRGPLNLKALEWAMNEVVRRHEVLRTRMEVVAGEPRQVIAPAAPVPIAVHDLSLLNPQAREAEVGMRLREEAEKPFDLSRGPLLRIKLLRLDEKAHVLLVTMHHIVSDAWSTHIMVREFTRFYEANVLGKAPALPELPVQYADYAIWQRKWLQGEVLEPQIAYWRNQLAEVPTLEMATEFPRGVIEGEAGASLKWELSEELSAKLRELGRREDATLFMTLLAAFQLLLSRYSRQSDIAVGSPIAGRTRIEIEPLIGFFVNTLVLRTDLSGRPTFRELLHRVRETALSAYAHQDVPFEKLVEELQPERDLSRNPLFQAMFMLQNTPAVELELPGLKLSVLDRVVKNVHFELLMSASEEKGRIGGGLSYRTGLFSENRVSRMLGHWRNLLESIVAAPQQRIGELEMLSRAERRQVIEEWNRTEVKYRETCVHTMVEEHAAKTPGAVAVEHGEQRLSYSDLNQRANQLARHLRKMGARPEVLVGIGMERSLDMTVGVLAILKTGAAYVSLDPKYPARRLSYMLENSRIDLLVTEEKFHAMFAGLVQSMVSIDGGRQSISEESQANLGIDVDSRNMAFVIYTSGSTGRPKGVAMHHGAAANLVHWHLRQGAQPPVTLQFASLSFDVSFQEIFATWCAGGRLVLIGEEERRDSFELWRILCDQEVTRISMPFVALNQLVEAALRTPYRADGLRELISAGEQLRTTPGLQKLLSEMPHCSLENQYGPSETHVTTVHWLEKNPDQWPLLSPIGKPRANTQVYLLNEEYLPVPVGVAGELHLGGLQVSRGYVNRPDLTAERFVPNPFSGAPGERLYKTGDLARYLEDGGIEYLGRIDQQVKVRGYRIELGEVESALSECGGVKQAAIAVREDRPGEKRLVGYVVSDDGLKISETALRSELQQRLPEFMVPAALVVLEKLPLTASGKVDRRALARMEVTLVSGQKYVAPASDTEKQLVAIWAGVLKLAPEKIGINDSFFELGGHSLLATQVISRLRSEMDVELPLKALFERTSIARLAQLIPAGDKSGVPPILPVDRAQLERLPLSFAQERLWFLHQLYPGSAGYNIPGAVMISGVLDISQLEQAFNLIIARHENLRTLFPIDEGQARQLILGKVDFKLERIDLTNRRNKDARDREAREICHAEAATPFDLAQGPLLRGKVIKLAEQEHVLLLNMHHIISDGWSAAILIKELGLITEALGQGCAPELPPLPIQYVDYSVWQRAWLEEGGILRRQLAYWQKKLTGVPESLELATDYPRRGMQSFAGATLEFALDAQLTDRLRSLAELQGCTLYMVLLAAFKTLLYRHSGQNDICVGTPIANRHYRETEDLIGLFVNTLALRSQVHGDDTFASLLSQVRATCLEAYENQDAPFERVVELVNPERNMAISAIFQVMVTLQNTGMQASDPRIQSYPLETGLSKFDLSVDFTENPAGLAGFVEYSTALYKRRTIERMTSQFVALCRAITLMPTAGLCDLDYIDEKEKHRLLTEFNDVQGDYPTDRCLHKLFAGRAALHPDKTAVVYGGQKLSYQELYQKSCDLALYLQSIGAGPDTLIGLSVGRSLDMMVGILGILQAGAAYVPLDPGYPDERLAYMLQDSRIGIVLTQEKLLNKLGAVVPADMRLIAMDQQWPEISGCIAGLKARKVSLRDEVKSGHLAYVIYTSGSTGKPKGVLVEHRSVVNDAMAVIQKCGVTSADRVLQFFSLSFDPAVEEIFLTLVCGATLVLRPGDLLETIDSMLERLAAMAITLLSLPTAVWHWMVVELEQNDRPLPKDLRVVLIGGERAIPQRVNEWRQLAGDDVRLLNTYGPTETTITATVSDLTVASPDEFEREVSIGKPLANVRVYVLDSDWRLVPLGVPGELYIAGAGVARGYLGRPELTAERFLPDPFGSFGARMYRSGDLVRFRDDGELEYLGRVDHQIKIRGFRIEPGEIEAVLKEQPGVRQAVVLAREDEPGEKWLAAYVVAESGASADELQQALKLRVPEYMVPASFVMLEEMPLTPNGKIDRRALPVPGKANAAVRAGYVAPRTAEEEALARIWCEVLRLERVGVNDNFFDLGGHSLLTFRLKTSIRNRLNFDFPLAALFQAPTIAGLVKFLERPPEKQSSSVLVPIQANGPKNPIFCVHPVGGQIMCYAGLSGELGADQPFYALQSPDPAQTQARTVEEMAALYLAEIRRVQPHGPYLLGGWSMGGLLAFEMAHQLLKAGEKINLLALFDSVPPAQPVKTRNGSDSASMLKHFAWDIGRMVLNNPEELRRQFLRTRHKNRMKLLLDVLVREEVLPRGSGESELERLREIFTRNSLALDRYRPRPVSQRIVLLQAASGETPDKVVKQWRALTTVGLDVHPVSGDHYTILKPPHVSEIASLLARYLDLTHAAISSSTM